MTTSRAPALRFSSPALRALTVALALALVGPMAPRALAFSAGRSLAREAAAPLVRAGMRADDEASEVLSAASAGGDGSRRAFLAAAAAAPAAAAVAAGMAPPALALDMSAPSSTLPIIGKKAPDFELPNSRGDGSTTSLANLTSAKKWTVLYFYPGAFTQGCTLEARAFQRDIEKYRALGAQIVGVSVDPPEKNASFCSSEGLDFFMLSDRNGELSKTYGSSLKVPGLGTFSNRQTYLIDPDANLRWIFTDVESRVPTHSTEVLEKLGELTKKA